MEPLTPTYNQLVRIRQALEDKDRGQVIQALTPVRYSDSVADQLLADPEYTNANMFKLLSKLERVRQQDIRAVLKMFKVKLLHGIYYNILDLQIRSWLACYPTVVKLIAQKFDIHTTDLNRFLTIYRSQHYLSSHDIDSVDRTWYIENGYFFWIYHHIGEAMKFNDLPKIQSIIDYSRANGYDSPDRVERCFIEKSEITAAKRGYFDAIYMIRSAFKIRFSSSEKYYQLECNYAIKHGQIQRFICLTALMYPEGRIKFKKTLEYARLAARYNQGRILKMLDLRTASKRAIVVSNIIGFASRYGHADLIEKYCVDKWQHNLKMTASGNKLDMFREELKGGPFNSTFERVMRHAVISDSYEVADLLIRHAGFITELISNRILPLIMKKFRPSMILLLLHYYPKILLTPSAFKLIDSGLNHRQCTVVQLILYSGQARYLSYGDFHDLIRIASRQRDYANMYLLAIMRRRLCLFDEPLPRFDIDPLEYPDLVDSLCRGVLPPQYVEVVRGMIRHLTLLGSLPVQALRCGSEALVEEILAEGGHTGNFYGMLDLARHQGRVELVTTIEIGLENGTFRQMKIK